MCDVSRTTKIAMRIRGQAKTKIGETERVPNKSKITKGISGCLFTIRSPIINYNDYYRSKS